MNSDKSDPTKKDAGPAKDQKPSESAKSQTNAGSANGTDTSASTKASKPSAASENKTVDPSTKEEGKPVGGTTPGEGAKPESGEVPKGNGKSASATSGASSKSSRPPSEPQTDKKGGPTDARADTKTDKLEKSKPAPKAPPKPSPKQPKSESVSQPEPSVPSVSGSPSKSPKQSSGSALGLLGMLLLVVGGGVAGALGVTFMQSSGYLNLQANAPAATGLNPDQAQRLAELESDLTVIQQDVSETLNKYAQLETRFEQAQDADAVPDPAVGDLTSRVAGLEQAVSDLSVAPPAQGDAADAAAGQSVLSDEAAGASIARIGNRVTEVRAQLEELASTVSSLETELSGRIDSTAREVGDVSTRVAGLEETAPPADLMTILGGLAPIDDVAEINDRLTNIESDKSANNAKRAALALSVADLARAAQEGKAFAAELEAIQVLTDVDMPSENLLAYAQTGMQSEDALVNSFSRLSHDILMAERAAEAKTFVQQLGLGFQSMFSVREKGEVQGDTTSAILARAEVRLGDRNLQGAISEMNGLAGVAAATARSWMNEASARVEMNSFLGTLSDRVLAELRQD